MHFLFFRGWGDEGRWSDSDHRPEGAKGGGWTGLGAGMRVAVGMIAAGILQLPNDACPGRLRPTPTLPLRFLF